jgi:16S rRNA (uracil1498-N3)-methyltransferase
MTRRRFYAQPENISEQEIFLESQEAAHLRDALRLRVGDEAFVFDGAGREFRCAVQDCGKRGARLEILAQVAPAQAESHLRLTLALALLKGEKFDLAAQKATELGVNRIVPVITSRADARLRDARDGAQRVERWRRVALAAAKQSGRAVVPEIADCIAFSAFVAAPEDGPRFMFAEQGGDGFPAAGNEILSAVALVGAEGGWAGEEISLAQKAGWRVVTLGGRILRAETAALVAVTLLQHNFGDLR